MHSLALFHLCLPLQHVIGPFATFLEGSSSPCLNDYLPTPVVGKICHIVNFQKCGTVFFCLGMMYGVFGCEDHLTSWVYTSLHGTYGMLWCLKEVRRSN